MAPAIPSAAITVSQIKALLTLYPSAIEKHYTTRLKNPAKITEALTRDTWRYSTLPLSIRESYAAIHKSIPLDISQLQTLVQWKITHGHNRPFLPAMIRKNDPDKVQEITAKAADLLATVPRPTNTQKAKHALSSEDVIAGIDTLCTLNGVGPATGALIASVYAPRDVPFFADETFEWLVGGVGKMKYDKKEYKGLNDGVEELRRRVGRSEVTCVDVEKAAFVLMHPEYLEGEERRVFDEICDVEGENGQELEVKVATPKVKASPKRKLAAAPRVSKRDPDESQSGDIKDDRSASRWSKRMKR